jgi:hypothetical protein
MTKEQTIGLIMGFGGLLSIYIAIFKPQGLVASRRGKMWVKMIGLTATRFLTGCLGLFIVVGSILLLTGVMHA